MHSHGHGLTSSRTVAGMVVKARRLLVVAELRTLLGLIKNRRFEGGVLSHVDVLSGGVLTWQRID